MLEDTNAKVSTFPDRSLFREPVSAMFDYVPD